MAAVITATGTWTVPQVVGKYVGGSGVEFESVGGVAFDGVTSTQRGLNLFDEVSQFVALAAAGLAVPPIVVLDHLALVVHELRRRPNMGERVYAP